MKIQGLRAKSPGDFYYCNTHCRQILIWLSILWVRIDFAPMIRSLCSLSHALSLLMCLLLSFSTLCLLAPVFWDRRNCIRLWSTTPPPSATSLSREDLCVFLCLSLVFSFCLPFQARRYFWHWKQFGSRRFKAIRNLSLGKHLLNMRDALKVRRRHDW